MGGPIPLCWVCKTGVKHASIRFPWLIIYHELSEISPWGSVFNMPFASVFVFYKRHLICFFFFCFLGGGDSHASVSSLILQFKKNILIFAMFVRMQYKKSSLQNCQLERSLIFISSDKWKNFTFKKDSWWKDGWANFKIRILEVHSCKTFTEVAWPFGLNGQFYNNNIRGKRRRKTFCVS